MKDTNIKKNLRTIGQVIMMLVSALLQAFVVKTFMNPVNLISGGFTGIAILIETISSSYLPVRIPLSIGILLLNIPAALICYKHISHKFTLLSMIQIFACSFFLEVIDTVQIFDAKTLNIIFGGVLYGFALLIALRFSGSTGGTDFISLYVSNKTGKNIWSQVFMFNCVLIAIFGLAAGWEAAGYSIIFQFITTKVIEYNYHRYECFTLQATTKHDKEIVDEFIKHSKHGISITEVIGGYSKEKMYMLNTVVSAYEINETIDLMKRIDPNVIINVYKTEKFVGKFYRKPIE